MNYEAALTYAAHQAPAKAGETVTVSVPINTGTHHTVSILERTSNGEYEETRRDRYPSGPRQVEIVANAGDIIHQRTTSPASADPLERYGVVLDNHHVDWGSDADWVVDFGPMGAVTRRKHNPWPRVKRGRVITPHGEEAVGGAVQEAGSTAGGGSG